MTTLTSSPLHKQHLEILLEMALGKGQHLIWTDGRFEPPSLRTLREAFPEFNITLASQGRVGRPSTRTAPEPEPEAEDDHHFVFWDGDTRLELDESTTKLVREALAERLAQLMLARSPAFASLNLVHYRVDWDAVLRNGVQIVKDGNEDGNRLSLPLLDQPPDYSPPKD